MRTLAFGTVLALVGSASFSQPVSPQEVRLFAPAAPARSDPGDIQKPLVARTRTVLVDQAALAGLAAAAPAVRFALFDGEELVLALQETSIESDGTRVWWGSSPGGSTGTLVIRGAKVSGILHHRDQTYRIAPGRDGQVHTLIDFSEDAFERWENVDDTVEIRVPGRDKRAAALCDAPRPQPQNPIATLRVMLLFSGRAADASRDIQADARLITEDIRSVWRTRNFQVVPELAHVHRVAYRGSGIFKTDLARLSGKTDGYMDNIHILRRTHRADVVALISPSDQRKCGRGSRPTRLSAQTLQCGVHGERPGMRARQQNRAARDWTQSHDAA